MKKILIALLTLIFTTSLCACGSASPSDVTGTFLDAVKTNDTETVKSVYAGSDFGILDEAEENADSMDKLMERELKPKLLDFDYEVSNEQIKEEKATVDVKFTTYNIGNAFTLFTGDYMSQAFSMALSGASDEQLNTLAETLLSEKLKALTEKDYEQTATISLTQKDGEWVIDEIAEDSDFYNAMTGGLLKAIKSFNKSFE